MTPEQLEGFLGLALRSVLVGKMPPNVGNAAATIARAIIAVREATELEARLAAIEARLANDQEQSQWRA